MVNNVHIIFFIECHAGFLGDNCSISCPYPSYGKLCNQMCGCSKSSCHHIYGCSFTTSSTTGKERNVCLYLSLWHFFLISEGNIG